MPAQAAVNPGSSLVQGIAAPQSVVDPAKFYQYTRRMRFNMQPKIAIAGLGSSDVVTLRQTGIVSALEVRISGTVTFGGTIGTTTMSYNWPYNLIQSFMLSANGQSNLYSARGLVTRGLEFIQNPKLDDTGQTATFGATAATNGSLKLPTDDWGTNASNGLNPGANVAAAAAYTVDLTFVIPVAADPVSLVGSLYAQTQASNLTLTVNYAGQGAAAAGTSNTGIISAMGAAATFASALSIEVVGVAYSIPQVGGAFVLPDLSQFHQVSEIQQGGLSSGSNQPLLAGTGVGRQLLRLMTQVTSGTPPVPLGVNDTNYSTVGWAFGGNDVPEQYDRGGTWDASTVRISGVDLGKYWGLGLWDFCSQFARRDLVDQGTTSDLRVILGLVSTPTAGTAWITQETLFAGSVGA